MIALQKWARDWLSHHKQNPSKVKGSVTVHLTPGEIETIAVAIDFFIGFGDIAQSMNPKGATSKAIAKIRGGKVERLLFDALSKQIYNTDGPRRPL